MTISKSAQSVTICSLFLREMYYEVTIRIIIIFIVFLLFPDERKEVIESSPKRSDWKWRYKWLLNADIFVSKWAKRSLLPSPVLCSRMCRRIWGNEKYAPNLQARRRDHSGAMLLIILTAERGTIDSFSFLSWSSERYIPGEKVTLRPALAPVPLS